MDQWKKFTSNVASNVAPQFQNIGKTFGNLNQQARERFGAVDQDDITELPQEYKDLERRVDALKSAHTGLIKVAKVYETESYDYPVRGLRSPTCSNKHSAQNTDLHLVPLSCLGANRLSSRRASRSFPPA